MVKSGLQTLDILQARKERRFSLDPINQLQLKFITDPDFRQLLIDDPAAALTSVGITPTEELVTIIQGLEQDLTQLASLLGVGIECV